MRPEPARRSALHQSQVERRLELADRLVKIELCRCELGRRQRRAGVPALLDRVLSTAIQLLPFTLRELAGLGGVEDGDVARD